MKSKAPLALIEQVIMILVFALVAALCLRAFSYAYTLSETDKIRDIALLQAENIAEEIKANNYSLDETVDEIKEEKYYITVKEIEKESELLGKAEIAAFLSDGTELFSFETAWQEAKS